MRILLSRKETTGGLRAHTCRGCGAVVAVEENDLYAVNRAPLKQATDRWDWDVAFRCPCGAENCITSIVPMGTVDHIVNAVIAQTYGYSR